MNVTWLVEALVVSSLLAYWWYCSTISLFAHSHYRVWLGEGVMLCSSVGLHEYLWSRAADE
jgi:hypothetical protein